MKKTLTLLIAVAILLLCSSKADAGFLFKRGARGGGGCSGCSGGCGQAATGGGRFAPAPTVQCGDGTCQPQSWSMFVPNVMPQQMAPCKNGVCPPATGFRIK